MTNKSLKSVARLIKNKEINSAAQYYKQENNITTDFCKILMLFNSKQVYFLKSPLNSPSYCGSVDGVPACEPKGHRLDSQSGHMSGYRPGPQLGA